MFHKLVIEDDIRQPNVLSWNVQVFDIAVIFGVPLQLVINPFLKEKSEYIKY
jgi:hypothetical protein